MLREVEWGEYRLGDLFEVCTYKKRFDANKVSVLVSGEYPYIVRMSSDNGQKGFINEDKDFLNDGNTLSFGQDTATVFYQERPYFTGDKIKVLKCKSPRFGKQNAQFFVAAISRAFHHYSWGTSSYSVETIEKQKVSLPVKNGEINFPFMEKFIAELESQRIAELQAYLLAAGLTDYILTAEEEKALQQLNTHKMGLFRIGSLFERVKTDKLPYKAKDLPKIPTKENPLPCLTSSFHNQGLNYYIPAKGATVLKNVISIPSNSDVYRAYFQSRDFTVLSDAYAIRWKYTEAPISPKQHLFFVQCINKVTNLPIFSYKNKLGGWNVVKNLYIALPIKAQEIDLPFMDLLVSAIQKLVIKDVVLYAKEKVNATKAVAIQKSLVE